MHDPLATEIATIIPDDMCIHGQRRLDAIEAPLKIF